MAKKFAFKNVKKDTLPVELKNGETLIVDIPTKEGLEEIRSMEGRQDLDTLYEMMALALSRNREGRKFSVDEVEKTYDIPEATAFMEAYYEYLQEAMNQKN